MTPKYEITNDQWDFFTSDLGTPTGNPLQAYDSSLTWSGANKPVSDVSWYEATQFVNWLNIITNHQPAYNFTGTQGTSDYTFTTWELGDPGYNPDNLFRNSNAYYFLPTEHEWVKAAYWNGLMIQEYATTGDSLPVPGVDSNYEQPEPYDGPWDVGSGSLELNGTYDMMGNVYEWHESLYRASSNAKSIHGGSYKANDEYSLSSLPRSNAFPEIERVWNGFRVASIPEPATLSLLALGGLALRRRGR